MLHKKSICWPNSIFISQNYFWNILERLFYHSLFELLRYLWVVAWICSMDCIMLISNCSTLSKDSDLNRPLHVQKKFPFWFWWNSKYEIFISCVGSFGHQDFIHWISSKSDMKFFQGWDFSRILKNSSRDVGEKYFLCNFPIL